MFNIVIFLYYKGIWIEEITNGMDYWHQTGSRSSGRLTIKCLENQDRTQGRAKMAGASVLSPETDGEICILTYPNVPTRQFSDISCRSLRRIFFFGFDRDNISVVLSASLWILPVFVIGGSYLVAGLGLKTTKWHAIVITQAFHRHVHALQICFFERFIRKLQV